MTAHLIRFNNYYNRIFKYLDDDTDYSDVIVNIQNNINFNPNDGVNTSIVLNFPSVWDDEANYFVLVENGKILSRWFVIDAERTCLNQYRLTLRRDLLADYYDDIVNAPVFIEKATVKYGNPLLFNSEDMTFNQIKSKETTLMDNTCSAWIVGYVAKNTEATNINIQSSVRPVPTYTAWSDVPFGSYRGQDIKGNVSQLYFSVYYRALGGDGDGGDWIDRVQFNKFGDTTWREFPEDGQAADYQAFQTYDDINATKAGREQNGRSIANQLSSYYDGHQNDFNNALGFLSDSQTATFLNTYSTSPTTIKVGDAYYNVSRKLINTISEEKVGVSSDSDIAEVLATACEDVGMLVYPSQINNQNLKYTASYSIWTLEVSATQAPIDTIYNLSLPAPTQRTRLKDAVYDMFCIPYPISNPRFVATASGSDYLVNPEVSMYTAQTIATQLGAQIYDLQLLPYCPIDEIIPTSGFGNINLNLLTEDKDYTWVYQGEETSNHNNTSLVLWASQSQFSRALRYSYNLPSSGTLEAKSLKINITEPKVQAMCDMYRLVSPNYNGQFEFNAVKNEGVDYFTIDATYKPYNPYIRVAPNFKGLYGGDYDDARGLICGGDFSLPLINDQWKQYEINNKNYLNAFNRQIENMNVNNRYQREAEIWQAAAGTVSGAAAGAQTGAITGGGWGALAGGVIGGGAAALGGIMDVNINEQLRSEALDYTKDQFGYTLGNIRALPYTLNRVSAFNINNKIFPILEYYTCSDIEKQALRDKIKYNGMTVMTIGTITDYIQPEEQTYIKGQLIRLERLDNHTTIEIANELNKGFYI